ncbi:hypothetical protein BV22DRAFT_1124623 [Leucogyrophana mollusca]|uniref:Uncharacterized protein n=1 Tax=Leucogyrophana mollusca TaxID=85980 RepID=A0ACB8BZC7_9AGAM|nr:hypothetical protein BV22DRAFT_1124623 [Leucogyrophana mollusca]
MSTEFADDASAQLNDVIDRLQTPVVDLPALLSLLCRPLDCIGLLPPQFRRYNLDPISGRALNATKYIPRLQRCLLENVLPTWEPVLAEEGLSSLVLQYFCPDAFTFASAAAGDIAILAYSTVLSLPLKSYSIHLLVRLSKEYPIDRLHDAVFSERQSSARHSVSWDECLRNVFAVPGKVANAFGGKDVPLELEHRVYFDNVSLRCEYLLYSLSSSAFEGPPSSLTSLLTKLANHGVFPSSFPLPPSQPSFYRVTLPVIRERLEEDRSKRYSTLWSSVVGSLPSIIIQQTILTSLFSSLAQPPSSVMDASAQGRGSIAREAALLLGILGPLRPDTEIWDSALAVMATRDWNEAHARIFVCWASGGKSHSIDLEALNDLLARVLDVWSAPDHVKYSLLSRHHYLTSMLLLIVSYFPLPSEQVTLLALSPSFISAIGLYISHLDNGVRRCGMLTAEMVAQRAGKQLDFGDWEGNDESRSWARDVRQLCAGRDVDADISVKDGAMVDGPPSEEHVGEIQTPGVLRQKSVPGPPKSSSSIKVQGGYDSDDSLTGYASPSSSRSASPTPSELDELEKDPTLRVGVKKIARPVYLTQLGEMVRSTAGLKSGDDNQEADKIEMALNVGEELIRRKRDYGTELAENASNLVYGFIGLQNNYDIEGFDIKRQRIVTALVTCCPRSAAPSLIEEFFKNQYSTEQRYVILNALALGARELASLPVLSASQQPLDSSRTTFPSKKLPPALHRKYLTAGSQDTDNVQYLLDDITRGAIDRGQEATANKVPEIMRERQLRVRRPVKVTELSAGASRTVITNQIQQPRSVTFTDVAAEFFIAPFINRFWLFLRDEQTREERTAHREILHQYRGAGTGLILNPVVLAHFLRALAILVHAGQNAPQWLYLVAPDALELAVTLGTRPISMIDDDTGEGAMSQGDSKGKEASVLTCALELALIILDGCLELDEGRSLGLEHTALLLGVGEWAGQVFSRLERGALVEGGGGTHEVKLRRAAAGVLLKADEFSSKWRRSMVDIR